MESIRSDVRVARGLRNRPVSMTIAILTGRSAAEIIPHLPIRMQPKPSKLRKCAKQSQREIVFNCLYFKELHPQGSIISTKNKANSAAFGLINREGSHATNGQVDEFSPQEIGRRKTATGSNQRTEKRRANEPNDPGITRRAKTLNVRWLRSLAGKRSQFPARTGIRSPYVVGTRIEPVAMRSSRSSTRSESLSRNSRVVVRPLAVRGSMRPPTSWK